MEMMGVREYVRREHATGFLTGDDARAGICRVKGSQTDGVEVGRASQVKGMASAKVLRRERAWRVFRSAWRQHSERRGGQDRPGRKAEAHSRRRGKKGGF